MTNRDVLNAFLKGYNKSILHGSADDFSPLLPFLLLDLAWQIFKKHIGPWKLTGKAKQAKNDWLATYNAFNKKFFSCFDLDQAVYVTDKMDSLEEYIAHDLVVAESMITSQFKYLEFDDQMRAMAVLMCGVLTEAAQVTWGNSYKDDLGKPITNAQIKRMQRDIEGIRNNVLLGGRIIDLYVSKQTENAVTILCKKTVKWLDNQD